ncbi:MAG: extracellular solute-binding protein [Firmicutes bacterium]|nr:extracellular solute-binding protein [Bacillota bacterium]
MGSVFKRVLVFVLVLLFISSVFAACGQGTAQKDEEKDISQTAPSETKQGEAVKPSEPVKLSVQCWGSSNLVQSYMEALYDAFPEYKSKVAFDYIIGGQGDAESIEKFRLALAAKDNIPDILQINSTQFYEFAKGGMLVDISADIQPYKEDILKGALTAMECNGKYYSFPQMIKTKVWYYRKDIFDEVGIDVNSIKTVDDFIAAGKKIKQKYPDKYIINIGPRVDNTLIQTLISSNDSAFIDEKGNYIVTQNKGIREVFDIYKKLKTSDVCLNVNFWTPDGDKAFADGKIVSILSAAWMNEHLPNWAPDQAGKWACALWPEAIRQGSESGAGMFVIPASSANKDAAKDAMVKWGFTKEANIALFKRLKRIPIVKSALSDPAMKTPDKYFVGTTHFDTCVAAMDFFKIFPYTPKSNLEFQIIRDQISSYCQGDIDLETALKNAEEAMKTQIGNPLE